MKGIGIASFLVVTAVTLFYTTIIGMYKSNFYLFEYTVYFSLAHALFYLFSSFRKIMPWSLCTHSWNTRFCSERMRNNYINNQTIQQILFNETLSYTNESRISSAEEYYNIYMLGIDHSKGLTDLGHIKIDLLLCLISIFILMYVCIYRGVKSTGNDRQVIYWKLF